MRVLRSLSPLKINSLCLFLIYTLAISLFAPCSIKRVEAAPASKIINKAVNEKAPSPTAIKAQEQQSRWRGGELLVHFREHAPISKMNALLRANGAQWNGRLRGQSGIERLRLTAGTDPEIVAAKFRSSEFVDFAEPNYLITADQSASQNTPDDARYSEQWALPHTVSTQGWGLTTGAKQTVIAIIDSGIDFSHPDLINNQWNNSLEQANNRDNDGNGFNSDLHGWDFLSNSSAVADQQGHGTAIAGIIAAQGNNHLGITGVMWRAGLMSLRVLDGNGTGDVAAAVEAIDYATANGAQVINCSWGTGDDSLALREAINRAAQRGVVVVTSAGNSSRDIETTAHYPASYDLPNLIAVAATDNADLLTDFSNWGATHVSIAAPGKEILTTKLGGDYQTISGTSASAPIVTGVAGLIKTLRPWLSSERTREMILRGARQLPSLSDKVAAKGIISAAGSADVLKTLPENEGTEESGEVNGGERGNNGNGRSNPLNMRSGSKNREGRESRVKPSARTQGAPGPGLPNLNELRRKQPTNPKAADPVRSTRCPQKDPNCVPRQGQVTKTALESPTDLLAWGQSSSPLTSLSEDNSQAVSDSPFRLFWAPLASLSAPAPLPQTSRTNFASTANGGSATASTELTYNGNPFPASRVIDGDRRGLNYMTGGTWQSSDATFPQSLQVTFQSSQTIDEIDLFMLQNNYTNPVEPDEALEFTWYGLTSFEVQYWDGSAWVPVPGGNVTGNYKVWKKLTFSPITTTMIRVLANASPDGWSRLTEVEAWGTAAPTRANVALPANGGSALASSNYTDPAYGYTPGAAINNERKGSPSSSNLWHDAAPGNTFPDWLQITFNGNKTIDEVDVYTLQDNYANPVEPTETTTFSLYGLTGYDVQYWTGSAWTTVPGGSVTGNNKVWRKFTFPAVTTSKIRVLTNASGDGFSRITEVEAWGTAPAPTGPQSVVWTNLVGVTPYGNSLSKVTEVGWNAGAVSQQEIASGDGYAEFTATETTKYRSFGLSNGDSNQNYTDIDFAIELSYDGHVSVYEAGVFRYQTSGTYNSGDRFRVSVVNGVVKYSQNGTVFYTSAVAPVYPLLVDTSLYTPGATITNAIISVTSGASSDFSMERVEPGNSTGTGGVNLLSGNANWSLPILGLQGRAGLDLGLALSYNSLVWTKSLDGNAIKFDADQGTPSPGFRLGFPVIQPRYYNSQVGVNAYLLITPSGSHVELRQVGSSNIYESADSSYLQLTDNGNGNLTLRPTDGSQLTYQLKTAQYQCTEIKDRNGNYISISHHTDGRINTIVDTLGRVITFGYNSDQTLKDITQSRAGNPQVVREWATFGWSNQAINPGFVSTLTVLGPQNSTTIPVLTSVSLADGSYYKFRYNSWGQVDKVTAYAADSQQNGQMLDTHPLNYTSYTLDASTSDCPRVTESKTWAEHWTTGQDGMPAEVVTTYGSGANGARTLTAPDLTVYKEYYGTGWKKGLVIKTEAVLEGVVQKTTEITYTQDDTTLAYQKNPRVTETKISDLQGNLKRTTIDYGAQGGDYEKWGLPYQVKEYDANGTTVLRTTLTDYNLSTAYTSQRIIGLVSSVRISGSALQSKTGFEYDQTGTQLQATSATTIQHDAGYNTGLVARGNLTQFSRYNVEAPDAENGKITTKLGYDTNGSVIFTRDHLNHEASVNYADSFTDSANLNTYAYPTAVTDPDNSSATKKYNYDYGAVMWAQGPPSAGYTAGPIQTFQYDGAGRISRTDTLVNDVSYAYQRWVYDLAGHVSVYTTAQAGGQETFSTTVFDGMGRVRGTAADNPNSQGGYRGQYTKYDVMGRVFKQSNPTEISMSATPWTPAGDDAAAGWVWTQQSYDWKGRPTVTTNPDGTSKEMSYGGCGCAGGAVVTVKDEVDRLQRSTSDGLGRLLKTEVLNQDTNHTAYSTTINTYNALDQITSVYQTGNDVTGQTTTLTYDGYGRLKYQQTPAQTNATTYVYNDDDTVHSVTDARGAVSTFTYNNRHLVTGIAYTAPAGMTDPADVAFTYDAAGNRTSMVDGSGSVSYVYDQFSRLTSEARQFTGLSGTYTLSYTYNLASELTSITDPTGAAVNYSYDQAGRMTDITGSAFASVTQYASNMRYRAWGAAKSASYGDNTALSVSYNSRLLPTDMSVTNNLLKHYEYYDDGKLRYTRDNAGSILDRSYTYDHVGRVTEAFSGPMARGEADVDMRPFKLYYTYDALNHLTSRTGKIWSAPSEANMGSGIYVNDKNTGWAYDADGRLTDSGETQYAYNAVGSAITVVNSQDYVTLTQTQVFDGNGARTKLSRQQDTYHEDTGATTTETKTQYFVTSSVLGSVITELNQSGQKTRTFVYNGGEVLAWQEKTGSTETMGWEHRDASNASVTGKAAAELDPFGSAAGPAFTLLPRPRRPNEGLEDVRLYPGYSDATSSQCQLDGIDTPCSMVTVENSARCPPEGCGPQARVYRNDAGEERTYYTTPYMAFVNGVSGVFGPEWTEGSSPQQAADIIWAGFQGGFSTGIDSARGQGQNRLASHFLPQNLGALAPNGLASDRRLSGEECDKKLAQIFGGPGAVVGSTHDPLTVGSNPNALAFAQKYGGPTDRIGERGLGHGPVPYDNPDPKSGDRGGIIHLFGNAQGTPSDNPLYAPSGGTVGPIGKDSQDNYYRRVSYRTGLTITFVHVIPGGGPGRSGSVLLGTIGGPDSGGDNYRHNHLIFYSNFAKGIRVDPRKVFCGQ